jgi:uncharacterized protein YjbI with pentapeptide repeats
MEFLDALTLDDGEALGVRVVGALHAGECFTKARLVDVELERCDLSGCDFSESHWQRVTLVDCRCSAVDLGQSVLRDVTFRGCRMEDANLRLTKLSHVGFYSCSVAGADFAGAQLERIAFPECDLRGVEMRQVRCTDVDLRGARVEGMKGIASLHGATIGVDQLVPMAPALAQALGINVRRDD